MTIECRTTLFFPRIALKRRILPPGTEEILYGRRSVTIGKIKVESPDVIHSETAIDGGNPSVKYLFTTAINQEHLRSNNSPWATVRRIHWVP